ALAGTARAQSVEFRIVEESPLDASAVVVPPAAGTTLTPLNPVGNFAVQARVTPGRSEEHTSELQSQSKLVCRLLLEKKKNKIQLASLRRATDDLQSMGRFHIASHQFRRRSPFLLH